MKDEQRAWAPFLDRFYIQFIESINLISTILIEYLTYINSPLSSSSSTTGGGKYISLPVLFYCLP